MFATLRTRRCMLKSLFRSRGISHGNGTQATPDGAVTAESKAPEDGGRLIVLTAPLTETIDHAGYFIQMALASLPQWLEFVLDKKYPKWREVERNEDGSAR